MKPNKNKHANILKTGILLFGIFLLLWSCQKEDIQEDVVNPEHQEFTFSTVSKSLAKDVFNSYLKKQEQIQSKRSRERDSNLEITPDWNSFKQENLGFTDALLSSVDIKTNARANKLTSRLIFLTVNDKVLRVIKSKQITAFKGDKPEQGFVYYHNLNGNFIVGFKIENGEVTKKLVVKGSINKASFLSMVIFQSECDEGLNQDSTFCNNNLEEVEIYVPSGNQNRGEESSEYWFINGSSSWGDNYHDYDTDEYGDSDGGGGGNDNQNNNCPKGQIYNYVNGKCECPKGKIKNFAGLCVDSPTPCETALLSRDIYNIKYGQQELGTSPIPQELSGNWELNTTLNLSELTLTDASSGFNSAVYQKLVNGKYQYMYVTEGSSFEGLEDWINNAKQLFGNSKQYEISTNNAIILNRIVGHTKQLFFTGHSLGGGLASTNALVTGRSAFTYNAVGLSNSTKYLYDYGLSPQINATIVKGEILDKLQSRFGIKAEGIVTYISEESRFWEDFLNETSPTLNTYKSIRLHMINTIIDILDCE